MMEKLNLLSKSELNFNHLKDILIQSRDNNNQEYYIKVAPSRFRKILSDIRSLNGLAVDEFFEEKVKYYDYVTITSSDLKDVNNNSFLIIKDRSKLEHYGKCSQCSCKEERKTKGRWVNGETGVCYYKEMIANNYTTKLKVKNGTSTKH